MRATTAAAGPTAIRGIRAPARPARRAVAPTAGPTLAPRRACAWPAAAGECGRATGSVSVRVVNAFHFCGIALAAWALLTAFLGITRENFPGSPGAEKLVGTISVLLALATIGAGIYTAATEEEEEEGGEEAALVLPR
jgi:hypothetical protein